jgi:hypothetical protein
LFGDNPYPLFLIWVRAVNGAMVMAEREIKTEISGKVLGQRQI